MLCIFNIFIDRGWCLLKVFLFINVVVIGILKCFVNFWIFLWVLVEIVLLFIYNKGWCVFWIKLIVWLIWWGLFFIVGWYLGSVIELGFIGLYLNFFNFIFLGMLIKIGFGWFVLVIWNVLVIILVIFLGFWMI